MSELKELKRLKDEERTLISLASLLTDQLNRLKVEELALLSKRRIQTSSAHSQMSAGSKPDHDVYMAEEVRARTSAHTQEVSQSPTKQMYIKDEPANRQSSSDDPLSHDLYDESHMIPLDLAVTSHKPEELVTEMEEEEEEDET